MLNLIRSQFERLFGLLDAMSERVCRHTYDFGAIYEPAQAEGRTTPPFRWAFLIEGSLALLLFAVLAFFTRMGQYASMGEQVATYFLPGLVSVSTTHDAGFYLSQGLLWKDGLAMGKGLADVPPGQLMGYLLAVTSDLLLVNLETAARYVLYASVALTSLSAYLLFTSLGQSSLGLFVGMGLAFFFPVFSRTSVGMVDTDQLNLFFVLIVLFCLHRVTRRRSYLYWLVWSFSAGAFNYLFYLWYGRPGMTLIFGFTLFLALILSRIGVRGSLFSVSVFFVSSGLVQLTAAASTLRAFIDTYVLRDFVSQAQRLSSSASYDDIALVKAQLFSLVGEIQPLSVGLIRNDYGSLFVFFMCQVGIVIWATQQWRRSVVIFPLFVFLLLYFTSGQRFSFFSAPLALLGFPVAIFSLFVIVGSFLNLRSAVATDVQQVAGAGVKGAMKVRQLGFLLLLFLLSFTPFEVFPPPSVIPPPVLPSSEVQSLKRAVNQAGRPIFIASWWDYGHEVRYQSGREVITDGRNPGNIKNLLIARAFLSPDPYYAADEFRFAAYFDELELQESFPRRPEISRAKNIDHDIYIFIPSELQHKMELMLNLVKSTTNELSLKDYRPSSSVFFRLYHTAPKSFGPFELVSFEVRGAVIYRLPAVQGRN